MEPLQAEKKVSNAAESKSVSMGDADSTRLHIKQGRGRVDDDSIIDAIQSGWDGIQGNLLALTDDQQEAVKEMFNTLIEDEEDLGEEDPNGTQQVNLETKDSVPEDARPFWKKIADNIKTFASPP